MGIQTEPWSLFFWELTVTQERRNNIQIMRVQQAEKSEISEAKINLDEPVW